jgi:hypothetical protein
MTIEEFCRKADSRAIGFGNFGAGKAMYSSIVSAGSRQREIRTQAGDRGKSVLYPAGEFAVAWRIHRHIYGHDCD